MKSQGDSRPVVYLDGDGEWNTDALLAALHRDHAEGLTRRIRFDGTPAADAGQTRPTITASSSAQGAFVLSNNYIAAELRNPVIMWKVRQGRKVVSEGEETIAESIPAGGGAQFAITYGKAKPGTPLTVEFTVCRPREPFDPAPAPPSRRNKNERPDLVKLVDRTVNVQH